MHRTDTSLTKAAKFFFSSATRFSQCSGSDDSVFPQELAEILSVLAAQSEWRVFVDGTANLGHQSASVNLLRRLIELTKYTGNVTIVFADYGKAILGSTAHKLALMFSGVDPNRLDQSIAGYGTCRYIRFLPYERRSELGEVAAFGFTGGADDMSVNYALELMVGYFLRIQPYLWDDGPASKGDPYYESSRIEQPDGRHMYLVDAFPDYIRLPIKLSNDWAEPQPSMWQWYAHEQSFDPDLARRVQNVQQVEDHWNFKISSSRATKIHLWPAYGLQHFKEITAEILLNAVLSALKFLGGRQEKVVLLSFSPHEELAGWNSLLDALGIDLAAKDAKLSSLRAEMYSRYDTQLNSGTYSQKRIDSWASAVGNYLSTTIAADSCVTSYDSFDKVHRCYRDLSTQLLQTKVSDETPGVHVVSLGQVPMDVFHQYLMCSDLPPIIEGQMSCDMMLCLGRPFLHVLRKEHVIKDTYPRSALGIDFTAVAKKAQDVSLQIRDLLPNESWRSKSISGPEEYVSEIDRLAKFVAAACDKTSKLNNYFNMVGNEYSRDENDKLLVSLLALREVVLADVEKT